MINLFINNINFPSQYNAESIIIQEYNNNKMENIEI